MAKKSASGRKRGRPAVLEWWQLFFVGQEIEQQLAGLSIKRARDRASGESVRAWQEEVRNARYPEDLPTTQEAREVLREAQRDIDVLLRPAAKGERFGKRLGHLEVRRLRDPDAR